MDQWLIICLFLYYLIYHLKDGGEIILYFLVIYDEGFL